MKNVLSDAFKIILGTVLLAVLALPAKAQLTDGVFPAAGSPANPTVDATWNHYYDYKGISELSKKMLMRIRT